MKKKLRKRKTHENLFREAYKKAAKLAASTPGFPSKDKILVE